MPKSSGCPVKTSLTGQPEHNPVFIWAFHSRNFHIILFFICYTSAGIRPLDFQDHCVYSLLLMLLGSPAQQLRLDDVFVCRAKIQKNQPWSENERLTFSQHDICILCENIMPSQQFKKYFQIISRIHHLSGSINFKWGPAILAVAVCAVGLMQKVGN